MVQTETFSPILYLIKYSGNIENAIKIQNDVPQGLSSSIMTQNIKETETLLSNWGNDCGIANLNIGTSNETRELLFRSGVNLNQIPFRIVTCI